MLNVSNRKSWHGKISEALGMQWTFNIDNKYVQNMIKIPQLVYTLVMSTGAVLEVVIISVGMYIALVSHS